MSARLVAQALELASESQQATLKKAKERRRDRKKSVKRLQKAKLEGAVAKQQARRNLAYFVATKGKPASEEQELLASVQEKLLN
jgi:hypothetical protein